MLQEETALTWRVCSFWKILGFFWCSKDIGCHPVWPAGRRNFFCTPEEITGPSSRRLQYPTSQNERSKRWKCLKCTTFNIFNAPFAFPLVCYDWLFWFELTSGKSVKSVKHLLLRRCPNKIFPKYYQPPSQSTWLLSAITWNGHSSATRTNVYAICGLPDTTQKYLCLIGILKKPLQCQTTLNYIHWFCIWRNSNTSIYK